MYLPDDPYPVLSSGPLISSAAIEHSHNTDTAQAIPAIAAMTSAAAAVQDHFDVQRPDLAPSPIAMISFICAQSGEGKSTGAKVFLEPHERVQMQLDEQAQDLHELEASRLVWKEELAHKRSEVRRLLAEEKSTAQAQAAIVAHLRNEPKAPPQIQLLYQNPTPTGLRRGLAAWPSGFIVSMDAGQMLNGAMGKDFDFMDSTWDGDTNRSATAEHAFTIYGPRLSALSFVQPLPTLRYFKRRGEEALDTGFSARVEWAYLLPKRANDHPPYSGPKRHIAVPAYQSRTSYLLEERIRTRRAGNKPRRAIPFTRDGAAYFRDLRQRTVSMSAPGGALQHLGGYAAKLAERVARYACIIHTFNDFPGFINAETLAHAECIVQWHSRQFVRMITETSPQTRAQHDAMQLEQLIGHAIYRGEMIRLADLSHIAPPDWGRPRRIQAWQVLQYSGRACLRQFRRISYVQLTSMPQLLPP
ncbi:DUF3987 domain-containing protein [Variovorax boronicumulans]|uniref:DUF3987 domain-containing protein n=1 Tax=Variovorax boronicumulans TaxID=436515 RepID=UPI0012E4803B|nr:DUF3987 domain-containing protein [Variovorax boronicumulans]GER11391.1 DUF3987 domain-containing protein [Variovorax boronicumulans]